MEFTDPTEQPFANVLLYGGPKQGKTTGAATAPGLVLYLNADLPNAMMHARKQDKDGRLKVVKWPKGDGLGLLREVMEMAYETPRVVDSIILDTYGEAYRRLLEDASTPANSTAAAIRPTLPQRGDVAVHLERFARFMCEAPVNFVIVAHEFVQMSEEGQLVRYAFTGAKSSSPSQSAVLMSMVDIIGHVSRVETEEGGAKYLAQLVTAKGRQGGDRFDSLGDWRTLDLREWFTLAGCHVGIDDKDSVTHTDQPDEAPVLEAA